jgi:hypothetical protein
LAIGYLAVGAPLSHPLLHAHHSLQSDHANYGGIAIQVALDDAVAYGLPPRSAETEDLYESLDQEMPLLKKYNIDLKQIMER